MNDVIHDLRFDTPLYSVTEAARYLGVPPTTFSNWAKGYVRRSDHRPTVTGAPVLSSVSAESGTGIPFIALAEGMVLAADIKNKHGNILIKEGNTLTAKHVQLMKAWGVTEADVVADFYDLASGKFCRRSDDEITIAKNGGGAHLDLMTAAYIMAMWRQR